MVYTWWYHEHIKRDSLSSLPGGVKESPFGSQVSDDLKGGKGGTRYTTCLMYQLQSCRKGVQQQYMYLYCCIVMLRVCLSCVSLLALRFGHRNTLPQVRS